ncbi:hypothetical protein [Lysinibacillus fusiformis]|uniref:hypothetical protein n=1 Tax=Lysinibacillus fusiformis TaxID=28031 RepID=UPI0035BFC380|nr:hypothetical protein QYY55_23515 [Lysinibacillus fusiformis]
MRTLQTELVQKGLSKVKGETSKRRQPKKQMSRQEIEELMGTKRPTYRRVRGAFRSK